MTTNHLIATRHWGRTWWAVTQLKMTGGSMVVPNEAAARDIAAKWGGAPRFTTRSGAASALNPKPPGTWLVDFAAEEIK